MVAASGAWRYAPYPSTLLHFRQFFQRDAVLTAGPLAELCEIGFLGHLENRVPTNQTGKNSLLSGIGDAHDSIFWHDALHGSGHFTPCISGTVIRAILGKHGLTEQEAAYAAAISTAMLIQKCAGFPDPHVAYAIAPYGMVESSKTVPFDAGQNQEAVGSMHP